MAASGVLGNGTKVGFSNSSPVTWTKVAQLMEVVIPGLEPDEVDTTVHTAQKFMRSMPGMIKVTEMSMTLLADLDPATTPSHETLRTLNASQATIYWRVEVPVNRAQTSFRAFEFQGWVKNYVTQPPIRDKQTSVVTVVFDDTAFSLLGPGASAMP